MKLKKVALFVIVFAAMISVGYQFYGHALIQSVYEGRSISFLNSMIEGQKTWPLAVYWETGDALMFSLLGIVLIGFFVTQFLCSKRGRDERWNWGVAGILVFFMVAAAHFRPVFGENELVYLINPRRLMNPGFLAHDWTWQNASYGHFIFDLLISPLTLFLSDLGLALFGRLAAWGLVVSALIQLARTLEIKWWGFVLGFAFWFYVGQSLAAEEWVVGGVEAKSFSYVFLLLALKSVLKENLGKTAIFSGLAICFHVLVGGWGAVGILAGLFGWGRNLSWKKVFIFSGVTVLCGLPGLASAGFNLFQGGTMSEGSYAIDVFFRGPHHMDPYSFLSPARLLGMSAYGLFTVLMLWKGFRREQAVILLLFLAAEMGIFSAGVLARQFHQLSFLYLYPFRLGPLFLLLFFSLGLVRFLETSFRTEKWSLKMASVAVLLFALFQVWHHRIPNVLLNSSADTVVAWKKYFSKAREDDFSRLARWIKDHTPEESVFAVPPWEYRFWLFARRAQVVSYKTIPTNAANEEWLARLVDLNNGLPFQRKGSHVLEEIKKNYPDLSLRQLQKIRSQYQARYYLTVKERQDLPLGLLYSNPSYYLYDLESSP